jgi:hypothetical protein
MSDAPEDAPKPPTAHVAALGSEGAPFIYFDSVATAGTHQGVVELELAARTIEPTLDGTTRKDLRIVAHLRCSAASAMALRSMIDKILLSAVKIEGEAN